MSVEAMQDIALTQEKPVMITLDDDDDDDDEVVIVVPPKDAVSEEQNSKMDVDEDVVEVVNDFFVRNDDMLGNRQSIDTNKPEASISSKNCPLSIDYHTQRRLIALVRQQRILYDIQHPEFLNENAKDAAWCRIANRLHIDKLSCRRCWSDLRSEYQSYARRLHKYVSQSTKGKLKPNILHRRRPCMLFEKELLFLYPFVRKRALVSKSNALITRRQSLTDKTPGTVAALSPLKNRNNCDDDVIIDVEEPIFIDLESEEHRILPYKFTKQSRCLISCIKSYPELYDTKHVNYNNFSRRGNIWNSIANELKDKATKLIKSWLQIQMRYEWELKVGYKPKDSNNMPLKPSLLQEMLTFMEPHIRDNEHSLFKQSYFLLQDWYNPIEHFKTVYSLLNALKGNIAVVKFTELAITMNRKAPKYEVLWEKIAGYVNCAPAQCEITWLVLRGFYLELLEMRKVGYQLQDKWYFEAMVGDIFRELTKSCSDSTNDHQILTASISTNKRTRIDGGESDKQKTTDTISKPLRLLRPKTKSSVAQTAQQSERTLASTPLLQTPVLSTTTQSASVSSFEMPSSVMTSTTDCGLRLPRITAAISLAPLLGQSGTSNVSTSAAALAMLANSQRTQPLSPLPAQQNSMNWRPNTVNTYLTPNSTLPRPTLPASTTLLPSVPMQHMNRSTRPSVTVSIRPAPVLLSPNCATTNTATSAAVAVNNLLIPKATATTTASNNTTASVYLRNLLKAPPAVMQPSPVGAGHTTPQTIQITTTDTSNSNNTSIFNRSNYQTANKTIKTLPAVINNNLPLPNPVGIVLTPIPAPSIVENSIATGISTIPPTPMVMVHIATSTDPKYNISTAQQKLINSTPTTAMPDVATLTPIITTPSLAIQSEASKSVPLIQQNQKKASQASVLNPNEIMIELISSAKGNNLVVHGPPLPIKYSLSMPKTAQLIREIMAIPLLHNKALSRTPKVSEYWQYISKKFNLPVHVCKASWNFLAENMAHFPQIAPMSELMRPFKSGLKVWEKSNKLFRKFNASAIRKGWLNHIVHLPNLMIYISKFEVLYDDVRRSESNVRKRSTEQKVQEIWTSARALYPEIENIPEIWGLFKLAFIYYMNDLERGIENPWPQNWWRVLEQLKFLIDVRYNSMEAFFYIVHHKFDEEVSRCRLYDTLMSNGGATVCYTAKTEKTEPSTTAANTETVMTTSVSPATTQTIPTNRTHTGMSSSFSASSTSTSTPPATPSLTQILELNNTEQFSQSSQPQPLLQREMHTDMDAYELIRAIRRHPHIYESCSTRDKRNAWLAVCNELNLSMNDCRLGLQRALRSYRVLIARDQFNRCRLNASYYKHFADIYRIAKQRGKINVKSPLELNQTTNEPTELIFPERFLPEINMQTSAPALVVKNWAYAVSNLSASVHQELPAKLRKIFNKYVNLASNSPSEAEQEATRGQPTTPTMSAPNVKSTEVTEAGSDSTSIWNRGNNKCP